MSGQHTPGPWLADYVGLEKATLIGTADRQTAFARMEQFDGTPDEATQEANARLIAAAPELLAALQALLKASVVGGYADSDLNAVEAQARAAIAKARGEHA